MMNFKAQPLTREGFAPFGTVIDALSGPGRVFFNESLENSRPKAKFDLSVALLNPLTELPLKATVMERHEFSSQTFLPLRVERYLVIVAPMAPGGGPDETRVQAFVAHGRQGLTYRRNTWHHGLTVLDAPAEIAVLMWCDGSNSDEEFRTLKQPFTITL